MSLQEAPLDLQPALSAFIELLPGLGLVILIAGLATGLHALPWLHALSPLILAIILGMIFHNLIGTPLVARAGVKFALRRILRAAIVLLGLQLTLTQVASVGWGGLAATIGTLGATFLFTLWMGRCLGVSKPLTALVAAGKMYRFQPVLGRRAFFIVRHRDRHLSRAAQTLMAHCLPKPKTNRK